MPILLDDLLPRLKSVARDGTPASEATALDGPKRVPSGIEAAQQRPPARGMVGATEPLPREVAEVWVEQVPERG